MTNPIPEILLADLEKKWLEFELSEPEHGLTSFKDVILNVWATSPWVRDLTIRNPDWLVEMLNDDGLKVARSIEDLSQSYANEIAHASTMPELQRCLRQLRRSQMLRIAWRDLSGVTDLNDTLSELSTLAEFCVESALDWCHAEAVGKYGNPRDADGVPQHMVVLGMGKLGGEELNFSSDIDLIFAYPEEGQTDGQINSRKPVENSQFFTHLGQRLIKSLNEITVDGFVFRVDVRLRPFGESGPLAISFDAMENYYAVHGRDWERYAMIKARVIAGDRQAGERLLKTLHPFMYRRYLDFGAIESLRTMKELISKEVRRKQLQDNVKLGEGGIREIEFIGQVFQLIRGGREPDLQVRSIQKVLEILARKALIPVYAVEQLLSAYRFLRRVENRLQMVADQQTHVIPSAPFAQAQLAHAMGYNEWDTFHNDLRRHRRRVHDQFDQVISAPQIHAVKQHDDTGNPELLDLWLDQLDEEESIALLSHSGFVDPHKARTALQVLRKSSHYQAKNSIARNRIDQLMPLLLGALGQCKDPDATLTRILQLLESVMRRSVYLALLAENPIALSQLVKLSAASPWIADYLSRFPILLDDLMAPANLYAPLNRQQLELELREELKHIPIDDMEAQMDRLRSFKQSQVLRVAAADVMGVLPLMRVSDQLTWIAEAIVGYTLELVSRQMSDIYGEPYYRVNGEEIPANLIIVAYGKLGGIELGYVSDLDIVFLHDSHGENACTRGDKSIDNEKYFIRMAQRIIHVLTAFTSAGKLYEVDTRLRANGSSGLLVSSVQAFEQYQFNKAWTWEHQALVRARAISGAESIRNAFEGIRCNVLAQPRDLTALRVDVTGMRAKMWQQSASERKAVFDIKKDAGGIADIEFMVQYSALAHAHSHPEVIEYTDNIRILDSLMACGLLTAGDTGMLQEAYKLYRDRAHALSLQDLSPSVSDLEFKAERREVSRVWNQIFEDLNSDQEKS